MQRAARTLGVPASLAAGLLVAGCGGAAETVDAVDAADVFGELIVEE